MLSFEFVKKLVEDRVEFEREELAKGNEEVEEIGIDEYEGKMEKSEWKKLKKWYKLECEW